MRLQGMKIFGSYARGEQTRESDIDVLILIESLNSSEVREVICIASDVGLEKDLWISGFLPSPTRRIISEKW